MTYDENLYSFHISSNNFLQFIFAFNFVHNKNVPAIFLKKNKILKFNFSELTYAHQPSQYDNNSEHNETKNEKKIKNYSKKELLEKLQKFLNHRDSNISKEENDEIMDSLKKRSKSQKRSDTPTTNERKKKRSVSSVVQEKKYKHYYLLEILTKTESIPIANLSYRKTKKL